MSLFGRALAGAGAAAVEISNAYIDQNLTLQKAKVLADLQHANAVKMDEYNLSAPRQAKLTAAEAERERTVGAARNETALAGDRAKASDPVLRQAKIDDTNQITAGTTQARIDAENAITSGTSKAKLDAKVAEAAAMLPIEVKRAYAIADASGRASAKNREAPGAELEAKMRIVENTLGRPLSEQEKLGMFGLAKARDPELDTQTVTTEQVDPNDSSKTIKTTRKEVRRPGAGGGSAETSDPVKAAMDAARAARSDKGGQATPAAGTAAPSSLMERSVYTPPPDSPAGKHRAKREAEVQATQASEQQQKQAAAQAYEQLPPGDKAAAFKFQSSPLFRLLSPDQQRDVYNRVNGR